MEQIIWIKFHFEAAHDDFVPVRCGGIEEHPDVLIVLLVYDVLRFSSDPTHSIQDQPKSLSSLLELTEVQVVQRVNSTTRSSR